MRQGTETYVVNSQTNRYNSVGGNNLTYDEAGNLTTDPNGYEYVYDYENRLIKITKGQVDIAEYTYDALGRRIQVYDMVAETKTQYYYNDNWQVLTETDDEGYALRSFVYGNYIDEVLVMIDPNVAKDYYYAHDHLYSPVALMEDDGTVVERYEYDAYGKPYFMDVSFNLLATQKSAYGNPYGFTGRNIDILDNGDFQNQHSRYRDYTYYIGRMLQQDPHGIVPKPNQSNCPAKSIKVHNQYRDGMNVYEYVISSPVNRNDPLGLQSEGQHKICCEILATSYSLYYNKGKCERKKRRDIIYETITSKRKDQGKAIAYAVSDCLCHFSHNSYNAVIGAEYGECGICGPDVTDQLGKFKMQVKDWFDAQPNKDELCRVWPWEGGGAWDIGFLKQRGENGEPTGNGCATGKCSGTVEVSGSCYLADAVNYYLWGVMASLCGDNESQRDFYSDLYLATPFANSDPDCSKKWIEAGYAGSLSVAGCDRYQSCKTGKCNEIITDNEFGFKWK